MTIFEECIMALGKDVEVLDQEKTNYFFNELVSKFPVTSDLKNALSAIDDVTAVGSDTFVLKDRIFSCTPNE